jgi:DNA polymerase sigma
MVKDAINLANAILEEEKRNKKVETLNEENMMKPKSFELVEGTSPTIKISTKTELKEKERMIEKEVHKEEKERDNKRVKVKMKYQSSEEAANIVEKADEKKYNRSMK